MEAEARTHVHKGSHHKRQRMFLVPVVLFVDVK